VNAKFKIRPSVGDDTKQIIDLVRSVVTEKYGHLFKEALASPDFESDWASSWVAEASGRVVGVGLCAGDYIDDLWVARECRGLGIGGLILSKLETQILQRGFKTARLRIVAENEGALRFYLKRGWLAQGQSPHERWGFPMLDMIKALDQKKDP